MHAEVCLLAGRHEDAYNAVDDGLSIIEANGDRCFEADLYRLHGQALAHDGVTAAAIGDVQKAISIATAQGALGLAAGPPPAWLGFRPSCRERALPTGSCPPVLTAQQPSTDTRPPVRPPRASMQPRRHPTAWSVRELPATSRVRHTPRSESLEGSSPRSPGPPAQNDGYAPEIAAAVGWGTRRVL